jgi:hypothetical protein
VNKKKYLEMQIISESRTRGAFGAAEEFECPWMVVRTILQRQWWGEALKEHKARRARQLSHLVYFILRTAVTGERQQVFGMDGIMETLLIDSMTLTLRDIFVRIFKSGLKASGINFSKV